MNKKKTGKLSAGPMMAMVVAVMMVLCAFSPALATYNGSDVDADTVPDYFGDGDAPYTYVSLGDSMVNGFGMDGYYPDSGNDYGVLREVETAYPFMINEWLNDPVNGLGYDFDLIQLAVSGMRSTDLRALLDPTFEGDDYTAGLKEGGVGGKNLNTIADAIYNNVEYNATKKYSNNLDGLRQFYIDSLTDAEIISYQFHYDFGESIPASIMDFVFGDVEEGKFDFSVFIDPEYLQIMQDVINEILPLIEKALIENDIDLESILLEKGIDLSEYSGIIDFAKPVAEAIAYTVVGYCVNFDANMKIIHGLNDDAMVLIVDSYNSFHDVDMIYGDTIVPLGDIYQVVMDFVNLYTKYLSPWAMWTYHVSIDECPAFFTDELAVEELDEDAFKGAMNTFFASITPNTHSGDCNLNNPFCHDYGVVRDLSKWNSAYGDIDVVSGMSTEGFLEFLRIIFNTDSLDFESFTTGNMNDNIANVGSKMGAVIGYMVEYTISNHFIVNSMPDIDVTVDDEGCSVEIPGVGTIEFSNFEISLLWMNCFLLENEAVMSHPSINGHIYLTEEIKETISVAFNEDASVSVYGDSSYIHAEPAYVCGSILNLGDSNARGIGLEDYDLSYDNLVAEALGINPETQLHDYAYPGLRIQDIRAIFDESVVLDGYAANFEDYIANARENIQDFADADLILLNAGGNNFKYLLNQINNYLNGDEVYEMDFSQISILDDETKTNLMTMQFIMDELINTIEDENLRFNLGLMSVVVQANAYGYLTFVDNYIPTIMMIKGINPDVNIVNIGTCNQFSMLYYSYGCVNIDVGTLLGYGVELYNTHIEQFAKFTGTTYVDIFDADTLGTEVAEAEGWANLYNTDENGVPIAHYYFAGDEKYTHLSANGHAYVADQIMAALDGFTMPDHIMGDWNVVEEPKEGVEGTKVRYCDICGAEEYGTIPALEHVCVPGTEYKFDETGHWYECVCGEKFEITEHDFALNYEDGMLGHYGVCECGYVGDIVEHVWSEADQDGVSHCECGASHDCFPLNRYVPHEGGHWQECAICKAHNEVIGHTLKVEYDNNLHWNHCEICGYYSEKVNHIMGDWTVTTPAEEGKNGEKMRECTGCDYVETQVIPALEHVCVPGTEWFYDDNRHWHVCECTLKHDVSDHNITVEFGDETHWVYCDICEYTGMENLHIMGDWTITIPPQADAEGEKMRECTGCDYFETQAIPRGETEVDPEGNTITVVVTPEGDVITTTVKTDGTIIEYVEAVDGSIRLTTEHPDGSSTLEYTIVETVDNGESVSYFYWEKDSEGNNVKYNSTFQWNSFDESITVRAVVDSENGVDLTSQMTVVINLVGSDGPEDITDVLAKTITMAEDYIGGFNYTGIPDQSTIVVDIDDEDFDVEVSPYVLSMISDSNTQLSIGSGCYAILIEKDLALSLAGHGDKIGISMKEADYNGLNEEQLEALGDRTLFAIEANAGGNAIHDLGSKTAIGLNFSDENVPNPVVCYMDENGDLVTLDTTYSEGWIVFYTDHFSYFAVMDESDLKSVFIIDAFGWVLVGIMVLIGLAVVFLRKN